jgi:hypothetical protein
VPKFCTPLYSAFGRVTPRRGGVGDTGDVQVRSGPLAKRDFTPNQRLQESKTTAAFISIAITGGGSTGVVDSAETSCVGSCDASMLLLCFGVGSLEAP